MFLYNGAPMRGDMKDRDNNLLISRVAGLGTLQHKPIGFTGPLSQHLLGYNSIINVVRSTMRDMVEASAAQLFTNAFAKRDLDNIPEIAVQLPFLLPNNCALNIAVKSYLDEITQQNDPTSDESKQAVKEMLSTRYFPQSLDLPGDLLTAFKLWDAVYMGVSQAPNHLISEKEKKQWNEANEWLTPRR
ncbi:temperature dependent protein affecting M2 dsRNA replication [Lophiotrema nucula]|uniref:Temperature dependent protein affecting M2 dsRNA replication n=1 Tax=Lophiotrema nucula TaxID=690887 RepID=A0A6A5YWD2_9PLEO|nr:temperature dependent protein affecting M2 dsRNA replication [Lophiotrema nucula]